MDSGTSAVCVSAPPSVGLFRVIHSLLLKSADPEAGGLLPGGTTPALREQTQSTVKRVLWAVRASRSGYGRQRHLCWNF